MAVDLEKIVAAGNFDLHMHTTASDGEYSPEALVRKAKDIGLAQIAITDHDTLNGVDRAQAEGEKVGMPVLAGVEISTKEDKTTVDILGYGVTPTEQLTEVLSRLREGREDRALRIIEKFRQLDMPIAMDDVREFSKDGAVARPHIAKAIVAQGYVDDVQTVFDEYLADGKPCELPKVVLSPAEGIDMIHEAGGLAVMAHPVRLHDDELVRRLLDENDFDGIEVWHRTQDEADNARYLGYARDYNLLISGGSDFHQDDHNLGSFGYAPVTR